MECLHLAFVCNLSTPIPETFEMKNVEEIEHYQKKILTKLEEIDEEIMVRITFNFQKVKEEGPLLSSFYVFDLREEVFEVLKKFVKKIRREVITPSGERLRQYPIKRVREFLA
jgi:cell division protein YceG involved in septum cleavage